MSKLAVATSLISESPEGEESGFIHEAREHILAACELLRPLSSDYARIAWLLEDALTFLDQREDHSGLDAPSSGAEISEFLSRVNAKP